MASNTVSMKARPYLTAAAIMALCSAYAFCNLFSWLPARRAVASTPSWDQAVRWELLRWNLWLPFGWAIIRWQRRFERHAAVAIGGALALFPALHWTLLLALYAVFLHFPAAAMLRYRSFALLGDWLTGIIVCGLILALAHARRVSTLESQLAQARLDALRMQLQPHFLFNTLHAIAALQTEAPENARQMLLKLAAFLRLTIDGSGAQEITLRREIDFVSRYLEIQRLRFGGRLEVEIEVDPSTLDARVPNFILQPIVENAIDHGIAAKAAPGRVEIRAALRNGALELRVSDTGPGIGPQSGPARPEGVGLANTRARLERLYGRAATLCFENAPSGGLQAIIQLPFTIGPRT